jgi:hypothetical protein
MKLGWAIVITATAAGLIPAAAQSPAPSPWPQPAQPQAASPWPQAQQPAAAAQPASPWPQAQQPQASAPPAPQQQAAQPPGPDPWTQPPQQQLPPCLEGFVKLRKEVERRGGMIQAAGQRKQKPSPKEACNLFVAFTGAETKMIKYATENAASCGIPAQIIENMKQSHAKSDEVRSRVCQVAAQGPAAAPAAPPSLSDALSAPVPDSANIRTGRGTYDTLTGNPIGK